MSKTDVTGDNKPRKFNKEKYDNNVKLVFLFIIFELLFFVALNLGGLIKIFEIVALILVAVSIPVFLKAMKGDFSTELLIYASPMIIYGVALLFSYTYKAAPEGAMSQGYIFMGRSTLDLLVSILGVASFFMLGVFINKHDYFTDRVKSYIPLAIFAGIFLLVFISFVGTMFHYGAFYNTIYAGQVNYFAGKPYPISDQAMYLNGFSLITVKRSVLINAAVILTSTFSGFFFLKDAPRFKVALITSIFGVMGLVTVIFVPDFRAIIFMLPALIFALLYRFDQLNKKWFKITLMVIGALIVIALIIGFMVIADNASVINFLKSNPVTRKIFLNSYVIKYYQIIRDSFNTQYLLGIPYKTPINKLTNVNLDYIYPSGNFFMDVLRETGWLALLAIAVFFVLTVKVVVNYLSKSEDNKFNKAVLVSFLITTFFRYFFYFPLGQYAFEEEYWSINYFPLIEQPLFIVTMFILGYMFQKNAIVKQKHEKPVQNAPESEVNL